MIERLTRAKDEQLKNRQAGKKRIGRPRYDDTLAPEAQVFRKVAQSIHIERSGERAMWRQLAEGLEAAILKGCIAPHSRIPPEDALREIFGVSITVVRTALKELNSLGLIVLRPRRGIFVNSRVHPSDFISQKVSFFEQLSANGRDVRFEALEQAHRQASETEIDLLDLPSTDSRVFSFDRLFFLEGEPVFHARTVYPASLLPGIEEHDLSARAMTRILSEEYDIRCHSAEREITAVHPGVEVAKLLQISPDTPVSKVETVFFHSDGTPFELSVSFFNSNIVPIRISVR